MSWRAFSLAVMLVLLSPRGPAAEPPAWRFEMGSSFAIKGKVFKGKDLSAAAGLTPAHALLGSDETRGVQAMSVDPVARVITVHEVLPLVPGEGTEVDVEAMAVAEKERAYYITGSHSLSRKKQRYEPERGWVFRLPVDAADRPQLGAIQKASLRSLLQADEVLKPFLDQPANANGLDVEGLAFRDGRLFFGLRAPSIKDRAFVLEVIARELFGGRPTAVRHELGLGAGQGIRELVALRSGGFLLLAGSSGSDDEAASPAGGFSLWLWAGPKGDLQKVAELPAMPGKAEGMFLFSETEALLEGLIFCDGGKDGAPRSFRLVKSPP